MNEKELVAMRNSFKTVFDKRKSILDDPKTKKLQDRVINIRKDAIDNNKELLEIAKKSFKKNDIDFAFAKDDKEARDIIYNIINDVGSFDFGSNADSNVTSNVDSNSNSNLNSNSNSQNDSKDNNQTVIAKSKSNTLGEIAISKYLKSKGMDVVETDLGDRILQLKGKDNKPTHPTGPASHLNVQQISDIVNKAMDKDIPSEPKAIMETVREDVLNKIAKADIGISGANAVASEDGSLVFVHNEGNISLVSLMKTHIVVIGMDKLVKTIEDAISIAKLETIYATGSKTTSYINVVSGPSKTADIEKKLLKNMYGAEKVFVVILDNGRSQAIDSIHECLLCIGCGSCIVTCPVYNVIGNEFGFNNYLGGRGVAMSKFIEDSETSFNSGLYKCTLCGLCTENCPVAIQTNEAIEEIRKDSQKKGFYPNEHGKFRDNIKKKGSPY
ncbi:LUD domain-containing protein [Methanobrevibacter sp. TMH8]|uniref:LUD domain-containing protein n=1 Tax=Methanobrevibacter sp. TMH8 TaxID=2848611 RepID=UPI001CCB7CBF|nr:LUD domain-containing protein [Methanobrevibacter sp. TMH8]MBZ9571027.1 LUD domain-containing protein [Methanobrevibacter sp. TMH8]